MVNHTSGISGEKVVKVRKTVKSLRYKLVLGPERLGSGIIGKKVKNPL